MAVFRATSAENPTGGSAIAPPVPTRPAFLTVFRPLPGGRLERKAPPAAPAGPGDRFHGPVFCPAFLAAVRPVLDVLREGKCPPAHPARPCDGPLPTRRLGCRLAYAPGKQPFQPFKQDSRPPFCWQTGVPKRHGGTDAAVLLKPSLKRRIPAISISSPSIFPWPAHPPACPAGAVSSFSGHRWLPPVCRTPRR